MIPEFDVVVAGGGIAGFTAGLTSQRLGRKTLVLTGAMPGGQLLSIERVEGFPGFPQGIAGYELCPLVQEQAAMEGVEFAAAQLAGFGASERGWQLTAGGTSWLACGIILATGSTLRSLGVPGELRLAGHGVSHCASCDGPLMRNRIVAVVGGGDSAMQEALSLAEHASRVIIIHRGAALAGQAAYRAQVTRHPRIEMRFETVVTEVLGDAAVSGIRARDRSGSTAEIEVSGLFVYVGLEPNVAFLGGQLTADRSGRITTDDCMRSSLAGICAAGSVRSGWTGRAAAAAGDGAAAAVALDRFIERREWRSPEDEFHG